MRTARWTWGGGDLVHSHRTRGLGDRFGSEKACWTRNLAADTNPVLMCLSPGPNTPCAGGDLAEFTQLMACLEGTLRVFEQVIQEQQPEPVFTCFPLMSLPFQVSFSESGSLGNSSGSDVTSLSSQLPDTPNSMVPSPVET